MTETQINAISTANELATMEQTSKLRLLILSIGFASILACLAMLLLIVNDQRTQAERRVVEVERTANDLAKTLEQAREAYSNEDIAGVGRLLGSAIVEAETLAQKAAAPPEGPAVDVAPPPPPTVSAQPSGAVPSYQVPPVNPALNRRVFIQFAGSIAREDIAGLNRALAASGWSVQGGSGERTVNSAGLNEVRYRGEDDRQAAQALADSVTASGISAEKLSIKQMSIISSGTLEVWMSK